MYCSKIGAYYWKSNPMPLMCEFASAIWVIKVALRGTGIYDVLVLSPGELARDCEICASTQTRHRAKKFLQPFRIGI